MAIKVHTRIPHGNARVLSTGMNEGIPEVALAADPHGGPETLWFCFRLQPDAGESNATPGKARVTLAFVNNLLGNAAPECLRPVYHAEDQPNWHRANAGHVTVHPDGRRDVTWELPFGQAPLTVALCYPYGHAELDVLLRKSKGYWRQDAIGLSQESRYLCRLSNTSGTLGGKNPGVYLIARQHSGETPASWVLDGLLERFAKSKRTNIVVWCVPLADEDGVASGRYGKNRFPYDLNRAWGAPPMRHEALAIQRDMHEWARRCAPALALDLRAPSGCESDGVYAYLPPEDAPGRKEALGWANLFKQVIGVEYAAENFSRVANCASGWEAPNFIAFVRSSLNTSALSLVTPYALCGATLMSQKNYRDVGNSIANAIISRLS